VVPLVGFIGGALCLVGGFVLLRRQRSDQDAARVEETPKVDAGV
jgi:hypothetical protein